MCLLNGLDISLLNLAVVHCHESQGTLHSLWSAAPRLNSLLWCASPLLKLHSWNVAKQRDSLVDMAYHCFGTFLECREATRLAPALGVATRAATIVLGLLVGHSPNLIHV